MPSGCRRSISVRRILPPSEVRTRARAADGKIARMATAFFFPISTTWGPRTENGSQCLAPASSSRSSCLIVPRTRLFYRIGRAPSPDDLPASVGLTARPAVSLLLLAADDDRLLVFAAVPSLLGLIRPFRRNRSRVAVVGVAPRRRLVGPLVLQGVLGVLLHHPLVVGIEGPPDLLPDEGAGERPDGDADEAPRSPAELRPDERAAHATDHGSRLFLRSHARAASQNESRQEREYDDPPRFHSVLPPFRRSVFP